MSSTTSTISSTSTPINISKSDSVPITPPPTAKSGARIPIDSKQWQKLAQNIINLQKRKSIQINNAVWKTDHLAKK